ncbi:hypothetical protein [Ferrovibrio sp.]|uniref:hypothetical protein n=1 Tax=Ferrovibrio sp. TaxID=1917215 RepID=UPI0026155ACA|nr:hypothetical protein [Ferrovibrio sp.]
MSNILSFPSRPLRVAAPAGPANIRLDLLLSDEVGQLALRSAGLSERQFRLQFRQTARARRSMLALPQYM